MTRPVPNGPPYTRVDRMLQPGPAGDVVADIQRELNEISDIIDQIVEGGFRREDIPLVRQVIRRIRILSGRENPVEENSNV